MTTVTLTIQEKAKLVDNWLDQTSVLVNHGTDTYVELHTISGGTVEGRPVLQFKVPPLPSGLVIKDARLKLYQYTDNLGGGRGVDTYRLTKAISELDSCWSKSDRITSWATGGGDSDMYLYYVAITNGATAWVTFELATLLAHEDLSGGGVVRILLKGAPATGWAAGEYARFYSREYTVDTTKIPKLEIDVEFTGPENLKIAPDVDDHKRPYLTWTPMGGSTITAQKIYRKQATSGVTASDTLVATLGANEQEYTDTSIDSSASNNLDYCYAVFTETSYNTGTNAYKSVEVTFKRPGITTFYIAATLDAHEGTNIDVQEKVRPYITAVGDATLLYLDWGDGGKRWWDMSKVSLADVVHYYTVTGVKTVQARAANADGYWSALIGTTGGHSDPSPQAIKPIARIDITPTAPEPFEEVKLDATRSYARCSDRTVGNKTFGATGSFGLPGQPQASPLASVYYKTTGSKTITLSVVDSSALASDQITKYATVTNPTIKRFETLTGTNIEDLTPAKDRNVDEAPLIGTDGSDVTATGARATRYQVQGSCTGSTAEADVRVVEEWALTDCLVDVPLRDDNGVVTEVLRGYLTGFSRQIRGGEPYTRWFNVSVIVVKRLRKVVDEAVSYTSGVGSVANYPLADYDGDGDRADDILVYTGTGGGGSQKTVSAVDYPSDTLANGLREVTLSDGAYTAVGYTTYWYEVNK